MARLVYMIPLLLIAIYDFKYYIIKNIFLYFLIIIFLLINILNHNLFEIKEAIIITAISVLIYSLPEKIIRIPGGDYKLFVVILIIAGIDDGLLIIFFANVLAFFSLSLSSIKKFPLGTAVFIAYVAFYFIKGGLK